MAKQTQYHAFGIILCPWASQGFFPGGAVGNFLKIFSRGGQKWWNLCFTHRNWKNNLFLLIISKSRRAKPPCPTFRRPWLCRSWIQFLLIPPV